jgi:hypothetical protein
MSDKIVQLVPVEGEHALPIAFYGLDAIGGLWYGTFDKWGQADGGPGVVR